MSRDLFPEHENIARLHSLWDSHEGQRCFIVGNGPSINQTDLRPLAGEYTFLMNRGTLLLKRVPGWKPSYWVSVNPYVIRDYGQESYRTLPRDTIAFLPKNQWLAHRNWENTIWIDTSEPRVRFATDCLRLIREGHTVTNVALQLAFHMGFEEVYLIGIDHVFKTIAHPNAMVDQRGSDVNHFDPNYFADGTEWQMADLEKSEESYRLARDTFEAYGRVVRNATVGGRLEVFERVDYTKLFGDTTKEIG